MPLSGNTRALLCAAPLLALLAGCAPHPATGNWTTATEPASGFNRLNVTYEGQALLFEVGEQQAGRHCFWGGESAQSIALTCKPAANLDTEERYRLVVAADGTATLHGEGAVLARFSRPAP